MLRNDQPAEPITFIAHAGKCWYCGGVVKMQRADIAPYALRPDHCWCLQCGQPYFVVTADIDAWEAEQWRQKDER